VSVTTRAVSADEADIRLDRWFRRHFPAVTQGAIQKFCRTGQVRVDGKRAEAATRLVAGQSIRIPPLPEDASPAAAAKQAVLVDERQQKELERIVLYRDDQLLVLDKPFALATQGGKGIKRHLDGMLHALRFGADDEPRLVHRLAGGGEDLLGRGGRTSGSGGGAHRGAAGAP
jgi:23S rRNA pseudouridine955/2504/2580 synthase